MNWEPVIGLEIHVELATKSKMFCACSADYFQKKPNTHTCPICLGLPGAMPSANELAINYTQILATALGCQLLPKSKFDRKNYFYPDLAKGFQISQYDLPFSENGAIEIKDGDKSKKIGITRAHMEEDTGKLLHTKVKNKKVSLIDFNRSGVPLVEIVSEPNMNSSEEAKLYAQKIQQIVRFLKISDADMEKGSMRIEPNVSLRKKGEKKIPSYKVELKNINSFKFAQKAIEFEIKRQKEILENGKIPQQETRGWNENNNKTVSQRSKEEAHDYRYFPEPDLPPSEFSKSKLIALKKHLPELPDELVEKFTKKYNLSLYATEIITRSPDLTNFTRESIFVGGKLGIDAKKIVDEIINKKPSINTILPANFVKSIYLSNKKNSVDESKLEQIIDKILEENKKAVKDYKNGKENALMFLVGQVMRDIKIKIEVPHIKELLIKKLKQS